MSFARRRIDIALRLAGPAPFAGTQANTLIAKGLRVSATITKADLNLPVAEIKVFGLPLKAMNQLSTIGGSVFAASGNEITLSAGDDSGTSVVFIGQIREAYADLNAAPDSPFVIKARTALMASLNSVPPTSFSGSVDVAVVMSALADLGGYNFVNYGVEGIMLSTPYLRGTLTDQIKAAAEHAHIRWSIDAGQLSIWPWEGGIPTLIPLVSKDTGLIGYPSYSNFWIAVDMEFNPQVKQGSLIQVDSIITPASGKWGVLSTQHHIESETPDGAWLTHCECISPNWSSAIAAPQAPASMTSPANG